MNVLQMDKITTDGAGRISIEPLNGALGILKRTVRDRPESWRPYGYMHTEKSTTKQLEGRKKEKTNPHQRVGNSRIATQ